MDRKQKSASVWPFVAIGVLAVVGVLMMILSTRWGPGVGGDATIYIFSARNFLSGHGLGLIEPDGGFRIIPYFPPLFSLVLSFLGLFGVDPLNGAHALNILLFGGVIALVGFFFKRLFPNSWPAVGLAALVAFSPVLAGMYPWAMSEPLFIFLGFWGLFLGIQYLDKPRLATLIFSAILTGLSAVTRYIGVAFAVTVVLGFLFLSKHDWKKRIKDSLIYGVVSALPLLIWLVVDFAYTGTVASRSMGAKVSLWVRLSEIYAPIRELVLFWLVPSSWLDSSRIPAILWDVLLFVGLVLFVGLCFVAIRLIRRQKIIWRDDPITKTFVVLLAFVVVCVAMLLVVYLSTYPPITLGSRMFSPVHLAVLILWVLLLLILQRLLPGKKLVRYGFLVLVVGFAGLYAWRSVRIVQQNYEQGIGYTSPVWQQSQTIEAVRALSADTSIVTNEVTAVMFLADRSAYNIDELYQLQTREKFDAYGDDQSEAAQRIFRERGAALVLFDTIKDQFAGMYGDKTSDRLEAFTRGLNQAGKFDDGAIYFYPASK